MPKVFMHFLTQSSFNGDERMHARPELSHWVTATVRQNNLHTILKPKMLTASFLKPKQSHLQRNLCWE